MKANELMIGDWVLADGVPYRVEAIHRTGAISVGNWNHYNPNFIAPIRLTHEILEKNGFERLGTNYVLIGHPFVLTNPSKPDEYKDNYWLRVASVAVNIKYVHELQHALRLCGIEKEITIE